MPTFVVGSSMPACQGELQTTLRFGVTRDREQATHVCCHNRHYAEESGFLQHGHVQLLAEARGEAELVFYDSVCGKPLFIAPRGRAFDEWWQESVEHGWPSFRDAEVVKENIRVDESDGEVRSVCGLHLGHNIPDKHGDRYCINLLCIAGRRAGAGDTDDKRDGSEDEL
eukprot:g3003.t1